jgi:UDP-N-acetyl-D-glucosamine/UDP-N-acetyl-D-galactosamine dehydrogenase
VAVLAVGHREFKELGVKAIHGLCRKQHVVYDIKYLFAADQVDGRL